MAAWSAIKRSAHTQLRFGVCPETCNLRENGIEMAIKNPNGHQVALNLYACLRLLWGLGPPHTFPERSESKAHRGCENYNELRVQNHAKTSYADSISVESHKWLINVSASCIFPQTLCGDLRWRYNSGCQGMSSNFAHATGHPQSNYTFQYDTVLACFPDKPLKASQGRASTDKCCTLKSLACNDFSKQAYLVGLSGGRDRFTGSCLSFLSLARKAALSFTWKGSWQVSLASNRPWHRKDSFTQRESWKQIYIIYIYIMFVVSKFRGPLSLSIHLLYGCMQVLLQGMESTCKLSHAGLYLTILLQFQWTLSGLKPTANAAKWDVIGSIPDSKLAKRSALTTVVRVIISPWLVAC